jgi:SsrA-binding protein
MTSPPRKIVARNRRAGFDYELLDRYEAGVVLVGTEVKSIREGHASIQEAYARLKDGEAWIVNLDIQPYRNAGPNNHEPKRTRKLLLHRREIDRIHAKVAQRGFTLIPTQMYFKDGRVKLEIALARGRPKGDKRAVIREREEQQRLRRHRMK